MSEAFLTLHQGSLEASMAETVTEHTWTDSDGTQWKAADYGVFVYMDGDKWTAPLESDSTATVEMNRLASELAALKAERQWRPIEDAPKDGTEIIGLCARDPRKVKFTTLGRWMAWSQEERIYVHVFPSHWLPLPTLEELP